MPRLGSVIAQPDTQQSEAKAAAEKAKKRRQKAIKQQQQQPCTVLAQEQSTMQECLASAGAAAATSSSSVQDSQQTKHKLAQPVCSHSTPPSPPTIEDTITSPTSQSRTADDVLQHDTSKSTAVQSLASNSSQSQAPAHSGDTTMELKECRQVIQAVAQTFYHGSRLLTLASCNTTPDC